MPVIHADFIAAAAGGFEPQRVNNYTLRLVPPGGDNKLFQQSLRAFPFPKRETAIGRIPFVNEERKFPLKTTFPECDLVVEDYVDKGVAKMFEDWYTRVFDPNTGKVGLCSAIKVNGDLVLYGPDGTKERTWRLIGVWPSKLNLGDGDYDRADVNRITVTLTIDLVIPVTTQAA